MLKERFSQYKAELMQSQPGWVATALLHAYSAGVKDTIGFVARGDDQTVHILRDELGEIMKELPGRGQRELARDGDGERR